MKKLINFDFAILIPVFHNKEKIKPLKDGVKQNKGDWGKKAKSNNTETKKSKFDWIKKLNIFKKSESQKKEEKNK